MKILFIQLRFESNFAVMCLSSFLKSKGYETDVVIIEGEKDYIARVKYEIKPEIIGYSSTTVDIKKFLTVNKVLKKEMDFFSIFGGPHVTFFPETIEDDYSIDAICIGEGEYALVELLDKLKYDKNFESTENLYIRKGKRIIKNCLRPLIYDLDSLPFLDKHIYDRYYHNPYLFNNVPIRFITSRGCPYKCTYCFNHKFFELYGTAAGRMRKRSVDNLIKEIMEVKRDFDIPMVSFGDDIFCIPKEWFRGFSSKYRDKIGLPYSINARPNTINEEIAALLSKSGCYYVSFSIETGDNFLRNIILKRNISDKEIIDAAGLLRKHKIYFSTGNMLGIPHETAETLKKTIEINRKCAPHYAWASLFQPFPRLELTSYAIEKGYFNVNFGCIGKDIFTDSPLRLKDKRYIIRFHKLFALVVKYPYLTPIAMFLVKLPFDRLYNWLFTKYKIRLNNAVLSGSREVIEKQYKEPLFSVFSFYVNDMLSEIYDAFKDRTGWGCG